MKRTSGSNTGLLLPWLTRALDEEWYKGMRWYDRFRRIFYVNWTHKSAVDWSQSEMEFCEGWAAHKGKKTGKNAKQLKATFRCALNSKKELKEIKRTKSQRFWMFIDPSDHAKFKKIKQEPKEETSLFASLDSCGTSMDDNASSPTIAPTPLITTFKQEDKPKHSSLPSFDTFCDISPLILLQSEDDLFASDFSESCSPHSEDSRFSPRAEDIPTPPAYQHPSIDNRVLTAPADVWQPNFMSIPQGLQDLPSFAQFSYGLEELIRPMCQDLSITNLPLRQTEMDQFVPAIEGYQTYPVAIDQQSSVDRIQNYVTQCQNSNLDDDYLLDFDVDPVACEKLIKELNRLTTT